MKYNEGKILHNPKTGFFYGRYGITGTTNINDATFYYKNETVNPRNVGPDWTVMKVHRYWFGPNVMPLIFENHET